MDVEAQDGRVQQVLGAELPRRVRRAQGRVARLAEVERPVRPEDRLLRQVVPRRPRQVDHLVLGDRQVRPAQAGDRPGEILRPDQPGRAVRDPQDDVARSRSRVERHPGDVAARPGGVANRGDRLRRAERPVRLDRPAKNTPVVGRGVKLVVRPHLHAEVAHAVVDAEGDGVEPHVLVRRVDLRAGDAGGEAALEGDECRARNVLHARGDGKGVKRLRLERRDGVEDDDVAAAGGVDDGRDALAVGDAER